MLAGLSMDMYAASGGASAVRHRLPAMHQQHHHHSHHAHHHLIHPGAIGAHHHPHIVHHPLSSSSSSSSSPSSSSSSAVYHPGSFLFPSTFSAFNPLIDGGNGHKFGLFDSFGGGGVGGSGAAGLYLPPTASIFSAVNITNLGENLFGGGSTAAAVDCSRREFVAETAETKPTMSEVAAAPTAAKEDEVTSSAEEITDVVVDECPPATAVPTVDTSAVAHSIGFRTLPLPCTTPPAAAQYHGSEAVFEASAKLLFLAVKWAKSMPSFAQILPKDQKTLLEESWSELFVITAAQYGLVFERKCHFFFIFWNFLEPLRVIPKRVRETFQSRLDSSKTFWNTFSCSDASISTHSRTF